MTETSSKKLSDAEQYIQDVVDGNIIVGSYVRKAVERHLDDLRRVEDNTYEYYFDKEYALWVCSLFPVLFKHTIGKFAGKPFILSPWQAFIVYAVFGWMKKEELPRRIRRFDRAYIEVARKNGKSTMMAAIALFMLAFDGEVGAQVYLAAVTRNQAKIIWNEAKRMIRANPDLAQFIHRYANHLHAPDTDSTMVALASEANSLDGLNVSCAVLDELHEHPTAEVFDVIDTACGAREQPLIWMITTAGKNQNGICYQNRKLCIDTLNKVVAFDNWFGFIACIDEKDTFDDPHVWEKANPNIRYMPSIRPSLEKGAKLATRSALSMNNFLVKHCCRWTSQDKRWLQLEDWDKCKADISFTYEEMLGRPVFVGMDLAEKWDLTALCLCFPPMNDSEKWRYMWKCYLPSDTVDKYTQDGDYRWQQWVQSGQLITMLGAVQDFSVIREEINKWRDDFDLRMVATDPWHSRQIAAQLINDGIEVVEVGQNFNMMSEPTKEFEAQIRSGKLEHDGSSLIRWQIDNVTIYGDQKGNYIPHRPEKNRNTSKVDAVISAVIACSAAIRNPIEETYTSFQVFSL